MKNLVFTGFFFNLKERGVYMDNKRFYKKISTLFWFLLATAPFWVALMETALSFFLHFDNNNSFNSADLSGYAKLSSFFGLTFPTYFSTLLSYFRNSCPSFLITAFDYLYQGLSISSYGLVSNLCSWFVWVYFIELCVDFIAILPKIFHRLLERVCDYL